MERLQSYVLSQIDSMSQGNPMISFMKPLITRALSKNIAKVRKFLDLIADENGNIDIENILEEMISSVMTTEPFHFNTSFIGDVEIGGGSIKLNLPMTNKKLVFNQSDLESFKETIITKKH